METKGNGLMVKWPNGWKAIIVLFVLVVLFGGCSRDVLTNPALVVLPGAIGVHAGRFRGTDQLQYKLAESYPAKPALSRISKELQSQGWKPLKEDYLNPGLPSSHVRGWTHFLDGSRQPVLEVRQWMADWTNARGDVLRYGLEYRWPEKGKEDLKTLYVTAIYTPGDLAEADKQAVLKAMKKQKRSAR